MRRKQKGLLLIVTIIIVFLLIVFVSLKNGGEDRKTDTFTFFGKVVDETGSPIENASIMLHGGYYVPETRSDASGNYSITIDKELLYLKYQITAYKRAYWTQSIDLTVYSEQHMDGEICFNLTKVTSIQVPLGPMALVTLVSGSTNVLIHSYINGTIESVVINKSTSSTQGITSADLNYSYSIMRNSSSFDYPVLTGALLSGYYYNVPGGISEIQVLGRDYDITNNLSYSMSYLEGDYLDRSIVTSLSTFYELDQGESVTISSVPQATNALPDTFSLTNEVNVLGKIVTVNSTFGMRATDLSDSYVSVTMTPMTEGTHHFQVYIENDLVIHVWEIDVS